MFNRLLKNQFIFILVFFTYTFALSKVITIAGTADLQGVMESSLQKFDIDDDGIKEKINIGGMAYISTAYKNIKKDNPYTVTVSVGDDLMNRYFHVYKGKAILSLMSDAGYDLYAFGNHEFDKGSGVLANALVDTSFLSICSDLDVSSSLLKDKCLPYIIKNIDGVKVGFFSLMTEDFSLVTGERVVKLISDNISTAKNMVKILQAKGVNIIVALTHIGYSEDIKLAKKVKGIDLIFGGHSHKYLNQITYISNTAIVNGGEQGTHIVKVDIPLDNKLNVLSKDIKMSKIAVTSLNADKKIEERVDGYRKSFPLAIILGQTTLEWNLNSSEIRRGESNIANLVNDLLREKFKTDIALNNAGAFRGKKIYKIGNITNTMLKEIDEFGNYIYMLKLKGKYLKGILERSGATYGRGGFMQVSGLRYSINLNAKAQKIEDGKVIKLGKRINDIEVLENNRWVKIEEEKKYSIVSNSFIVNQEGDGYFWFNKYGTNLVNTYATFYSIMAEYINKKKIVTPKIKDGRIKIIH